MLSPEFEKSIFRKGMGRGILPKHLGYRADQFQRLLLATQHLLQNILKTLYLMFSFPVPFKEFRHGFYIQRIHEKGGTRQFDSDDIARLCQRVVKVCVYVFDGIFVKMCKNIPVVIVKKNCQVTLVPAADTILAISFKNHSSF